MTEYDGRVILKPKGMAVEHEIIATFFKVDKGTIISFF